MPCAASRQIGFGTCGVSAALAIEVTRLMICAFEGWNDAAGAATGVLDHLIDVWDAQLVAAIDPESLRAGSPEPRVISHVGTQVRSRLTE